MLTQFKVIFKSPNAIKLFLAGLFSNVGDWFYMTAITIYLARNNALEGLAFLTTFRMFCMFFLMPIGGTIVDKLPKRKVMIIADLARFLFTLIIAAGVADAANSHVILIIFLSTANILFSIFFGPARKALLPRLVEKEHRSALNALDGALSTSILTLAPALAGIVLIYYGAAVAVTINAISFLLSSYFIFKVTEVENISEPITIHFFKTKQKLVGIFEDTKVGFAHILKSPEIMISGLMGVFCSFGVGATWVFIPLITLKLGLGDSAVGFMSSVLGVGSVIGMLIGGSVPVKHHIAATVVAIFLFGCGFLFWSQGISTIWGAFGGVFLIALFANVFEAPAASILQNHTDDSLFARVFSAVDAFVILGLSLGTNLAVFLSKDFSLGYSISFTGFVLVTAASLASLWINKFNFYKKTIKI